MIKHFLFFVLVILCYNTAFSQNDDKANVLAVERNTADAFTKHNLAFLNSIFTDDIKVISAAGNIMNKQQLLQSVQNVNSATVSDMEVKIINTIAIVTGTETETGKDNSGNVYSNKMLFTDVLEKTKGQWQIIATQATAIQQ